MIAPTRRVGGKRPSFARAQVVASHDVRRGVLLFLVSDVAAEYWQIPDEAWRAVQ